jgi:signal transduction histidine kinase
MAERLWKILLIEDDEDDYILTRETLLEASGEKLQLSWASTYESGREALTKHDFDAVLMDYDLGPQTGLELTLEASQLGCKAPIILLTGRGNYEVDLEAMKSGVTDYLAKSEVTPRLLERTIRYSILRKQTEDALLTVKEELETGVQERTHELIVKNNALEAEIHERRRVEGELAEVQRRLLDRAEADRRELARDLHDGPMQELYGIVFEVDALQDNTSTPAEVKEHILQVVQALRSISRELRPPALAPYGLEKAIQSHLENLQQTHPELVIKTELMADGQLLPETVRMALYRIYQMAITNIIRHAQASQVTIRLMLADEAAQLEIQDNGCGFDVPSRWIELARQGHLGLAGAAERAEAAGGKLHVDSDLGKGTTIRVNVPRTNNGL